MEMVSFLFVVVVLVIVPGPDTLLFIRALSLCGWRHAASVSLGVILGCLCWGVLVLFGLEMLLDENGYVMVILKWCGAGYLLWLGMSYLMKKDNMLEPMEGKAEVAGYFRKGFLSNILNPKVGGFYIVVLPLFISSKIHFSQEMIYLIALHVLVYLTWSLILSVLSMPFVSALKKDANRKLLDKVTGWVLILFSLGVLALGNEV